MSPPAVETADLHYRSSEDFLQELADFQASVFEGDYYDEEALEYFSEDPFDREYYHNKYGAYDYDPDMHEGLNALGEFLTEADSYFQAKRYDVAAEAYELLISIFDDNPEGMLGVYEPLAELGEMEQALAQRYFVALQESQPTAVLYDKALIYVGRHDQSYDHRHRDHFPEMVEDDRRSEVQMFLERWADELTRKQFDPVPIGVPFHLQLPTA